MPASKKTIGLALSGASSRSTFYIGFLEVLAEHDVPIHYIAACSSATIVAASFAAGTLSELKERMLSLDGGFLYSLLEQSRVKGGLYNLDTVEELLRVYTKGLKFEDVTPAMGFVAVDIHAGEQVVLSMGDMAHAARISCTLPGLFEPVAWGNKLLVDGGLLSIVPGDVVKASGVDHVVGVDMRGNRHIFSKNQMRMREAFLSITNIFPVQHAQRLWKSLTSVLTPDMLDYYSDPANVPDRPTYPGMFAVLGRSLDLAIVAEQKHQENGHFDCDLLIRPELPKAPLLKRYLQIMSFGNSEDLYKLGRATGEEYLGEIEKLIG